MKEFDKYTDIEIARKIINGEIELFEIIIRRYNPYIYKIGRSYNYNHEDTQDLMQDTFIDAYTALSKFENRSSLKTWIIKIMLNNCYKKQHKWSSKNITSSEINDYSKPLFSTNENTDPIKKVMRKELNIVIENALEHIPLHYRLVFILREVNGLNIVETAEALELSETNVKTRLNRAKSFSRVVVQKVFVFLSRAKATL